jgi:predicted porin
MLSARWQATDSLVFKGGYQRQQIGTPSNYENYNVTNTTTGIPLTLAAGQTNYAVNVLFAGAQFQATPTIKVSGGYYYAGTPAAGTCVTGTAFSSKSGGCTGTAQYEALLVDYSFSKRTNLYAMAGNTTLTGGQTYTYANVVGGATTAKNMTGQQTYALGMRHMF